MKKVVSATLAGALAVGMVPAMALADDAVELQAIGDQAAIEAGAIVAFAGGTNPATEFVKGDEAIKAIIPIAVEEGGATEGVEYNVSNYKYVKIDPTATVGASDPYVIVAGKKVKAVDAEVVGALPTTTGTYAIFAQAYVDANENGAFDTGEDAYWVTDGVAFTVVNKAVIGELAFYEGVTVDGEVVASDTTHIYKGAKYDICATSYADGKLAVSSDGVALEPGVDYTIATPIVVKDANTNLTAADRAAAGEYYVEVNFEGVYKKVFYTIEKFDVAKADIELASNTVTLAQAKANGASAFTIDSVNDGDNDAMVEIVKTSEDFKSENLLPGEYTVTVGLKAAYAKDPSVVAGSTQDVKVAIVGKVINDLVLTYPLGTSSISAADDDLSPVTTDDYSVNRSAADYTAAKEFDVSKLIVTDGSGKVYTNIKPVVSKKNVYGEYVECDASELTNGSWGEYQVKAVLVDSTYATAGETAAIEVSITNGEIQNADVAFAYKNDNVLVDEYDGANALVYSGVDFMDDLAVAVKCNGKAVPASDYSIVVEKWNAKTSKYEVCETVIDNGEYRISVDSAKYDVKSNCIYVDIVPVNVVPIQADQVKAAGYAGSEFLYTGEEISVIDVFQQLNKAGNARVKDAKGNYIPVDVPETAYKIAITKFVPEGETAAVLTKDLPASFVEPGTYTFTVVDTSDVAAKGDDNWKVINASATYTVKIVTDNVFVDVPADAWYADEVLAVAQANIMRGYGVSKMFGPNDGMKRGDVALALGRALGLAADPVYDGTNTIIKVITGFEDVDGGAYYARAIKAMADAGIMTGFGDGTYGPNELVTREQLATILCRIEESGLGDASILASALDAYADADEVSKFAVEAMEWAVENGIMGVDTQFLNPTDAVTRAEVAAMLVRFDAKFDAFAAL